MKGSTLRSLFLWVVFGLLLRWLMIEPRWIPSGSMIPTLNIKDRILVEKLRINCHQSIPLNSIVVFKPPINLTTIGYDPRSALIKRVVGRPGDIIEIKDGRFWRNNNVTLEDFDFEKNNYDMARIIVPKNTILALGDNRNFSLDSHLWGPLPIENLIGTAIWRYWPLNKFGLI